MLLMILLWLKWWSELLLTGGGLLHVTRTSKILGWLHVTLPSNWLHVTWSHKVLGNVLLHVTWPLGLAWPSRL